MYYYEKPKFIIGHKNLTENAIKKLHYSVEESLKNLIENLENRLSHLNFCFERGYIGWQNDIKFFLRFIKLTEVIK